MENWLQHALPPSDRILERDVDSWALTRHDIEVAIRRSGNTMAGPNRLPYEAWRQLGDTAVDAFFEAGLAMQQPDFPSQIRAAYGLLPHEPHPFNLGILVCLPKRPPITVSMARCTHPRGPDPSASWTPLTAFSPTASAIAGNLLSRWISPQQRGFLPGSILANVVDVEEAALQSALAHDMPATFLFDFSAAFPSVNQEYLLRALSHIGFPLPALHAVRALYDNNRCRLAFAGALWGDLRCPPGSDRDALYPRYSSQQCWILLFGNYSVFYRAKPSVHTLMT